MKTAIATVCLSGSLDEKLEAIASAGFKAVEFFENDLLSFNGTPSDVFEARLQHAVDLYKAGVAPYLVVTGGKLPAAGQAGMFPGWRTFSAAGSSPVPPSAFAGLRPGRSRC